MERGSESDGDNDDEEHLRDHFRLASISICKAEAKKNGMDISEPIIACISNLAFRYTEKLAQELELFAQHGARKIINAEDVILSAHRNEHLASLLKTFCSDLKEKEPQSERKPKRKKTLNIEDKATANVIHIPDI